VDASRGVARKTDADGAGVGFAKRLRGRRSIVLSESGDFMKQILLQVTKKQYDDLLKFLDRRCKIQTDEIADFQSVRAALRSGRVVDIPAVDRKRTARTEHSGPKPTKPESPL
jgi:hypothetical protein